MKTWDTWDFQDRILAGMESKRRYRREHIDRIDRGQSNGSHDMLDALTGEIAALGRLLGGANYPTAADMAAAIDELLKGPVPPPSDGAEADAFAQGWSQALREMRSKLQPYLQV